MAEDKKKAPIARVADAARNSTSAGQIKRQAGGLVARTLPTAAAGAAILEYLTGGGVSKLLSPAPEPAKAKVKGAPQGKPLIRMALDQIKDSTPKRALSPQEQAAAFVASQFDGPLSIGEAAALTGMLPAPAKPQTDRDKAYGVASQIAGAQYQSTLAQAAKTFGTDTPEYRDAYDKATTDYFNRQAGILQFDPLKFGIASQFDAE